MALLLPRKFTEGLVGRGKKDNQWKMAKQAWCFDLQKRSEADKWVQAELQDSVLMFVLTQEVGSTTMLNFSLQPVRYHSCLSAAMWMICAFLALLSLQTLVKFNFEFNAVAHSHVHVQFCFYKTASVTAAAPKVYPSLPRRPRSTWELTHPTMQRQ